MPDQKNTLIGGALVLIGAVFFSAKAVLVKLAYQFDVDSISLLALRFLFALPVYLVVAAVVRKKRQPEDHKVKRKDWIQLILFGVAGYYLASMLDFIGLQYISASLERLILFTYPTIVVLLSALIYRQGVKRYQWGALLLTYLGIGMAFMESFQLTGQENFMLGATLIFLCAITYATYIIGSGYLIPRLGTFRFTSLAMTAASIAVLLHHLITRQWNLFHFAPEVYYLSLIMAIFSTVIPSFLISEGIRRIGASNAAIIGSVGPVSTIILAYIFLGERLGPIQLIGTALVIAGVLMITLRKKRTSLANG